MAPDAVHGDAEELGVEFLEFGEDFVVEGHLIAADGASVRGIEGEDDGAAAEFAEGEALIGSDVEGEIGSRSSGL